MTSVEQQLEGRRQSGLSRFYSFGERVARGAIVGDAEIALAISDAGKTAENFDAFVTDYKRRDELRSVLCRKRELMTSLADIENALMPLRHKQEQLRVAILEEEAKCDAIQRTLAVDHEAARAEVQTIESRWPGKSW